MFLCSICFAVPKYIFLNFVSVCWFCVYGFVVRDMSLVIQTPKKPVSSMTFPHEFASALGELGVPSQPWIARGCIVGNQHELLLPLLLFLRLLVTIACPTVTIGINYFWLSHIYEVDSSTMANHARSTTKTRFLDTFWCVRVSIRWTNKS
jgi:hypothetical protein